MCGCRRSTKHKTLVLIVWFLCICLLESLSIIFSEPINQNRCKFSPPHFVCRDFRQDLSLDLGSVWLLSAWSTLIGRGSALIALVKIFIVLLHHWHWGVFCLLLAGSLWHKEYLPWLPCTERSYYRRHYDLKNQQ